MKFDCGETAGESYARHVRKLRERERWRPFFALLPREVGPHDCRWLEWIERRAMPSSKPDWEHYAPTWEYRLPIDGLEAAWRGNEE